MARLEDAVRPSALVDATVRVAEDDVVAAGHRLDRERLDGGGEERVAEVAHDRTDEHRRGAAQAARERVRPVAQLPGRQVDPLAGLGRDRHRVGASLRTRETVLCETPATSAMSRIVVTEVGEGPRRAEPALCVVSLPTGCLRRCGRERTTCDACIRCQ